MKARSQSSSIPTKRSESLSKGVRKSSHELRPSSRGKRGASPRISWNRQACLSHLRRLGSRKNVEGMARFGTVAKNVLGVPKPAMNQLAKRIGRDHDLALALWKSGVHDARILAGMIADPARLTSAQMDKWVRDFDNWDICDGTACHLFVFTPSAWEKAVEWTSRRSEFEKRAGFALIAYLAYRDKTSPDAEFKRCFRIIEGECEDERHFVKKAVNWALRNIGKRTIALNREAIRTAEKIRKRESPAARWIAADALRELRSEAVMRRLQKKRSQAK
jgi:3-methyladenine DNA glycosylase AlkD